MAKDRNEDCPLLPFSEARQQRDGNKGQSSPIANDALGGTVPDHCGTIPTCLR